MMLRVFVFSLMSCVAVEAFFVGVHPASPAALRHGRCVGEVRPVVTRQPHTQKQRSPRTALFARGPPKFLPEGSNPLVEFWDQVPVGALAFAAVLFVFPSFFLGLFNAFFALFFILPPIVGFAVQTWAKFNVLTSPCPVCDAEVRGLKSNMAATCFNCGANLMANTDQTAWRLKNPYDDVDVLREDSGGRGPSTSGVIDVEAETITTTSEEYEQRK